MSGDRRGYRFEGIERGNDADDKGPPHLLPPFGCYADVLCYNSRDAETNIVSDTSVYRRNTVVESNHCRDPGDFGVSPNDAVVTTQTPRLSLSFQ